MKRRLLLACCILLLTAGLGALRFFRLTGGHLPSRSAGGSTLPPLLTFAPEFSEESDALLELNTADQAALETLPGIGEALARRILAYRETYGPFSSVDELQAVDGIGPGILARLRPYVTVAPTE